jgi:hypothetical protein
MQDRSGQQGEAAPKSQANFFMNTNLVQLTLLGQGNHNAQDRFSVIPTYIH